MNKQNEKRAKFLNLAEKRVTKTIRSIRLIGNLSNRSSYDYNEAEVHKIITALEDEIRKVKLKFASKKRVDDMKFKF